jgi:hypothetical protein
MRALAGWILVLALAGAPALAGTGGAGEGKDAAAKSNGTSAATENSSTPTADAPKTEGLPKAAAPAAPSMENQIQQLRDLVEAQSRQLQAQNEQLRDQQRKMYQMEDQLRVVNQSVENVGAGLGINPATNAGFIAYNGDEKKDDTVATIRFKGVTIQPGGFFAAEGVYRNHAINNDVNTDFKGVPMPGSSQARVSELNFSGRQSQLTLLVTGKLDNIRLRGYEEGDFLSAGVTSNNNQTNSYTFRQRQLWAQATLDSGWQFTGGQMWTLVTETSHLLDPLTEVRPRTVDAQYTLGFSWARQYGFRISKNFGDHFAVGLSVENPQTTFTAHGFAINAATPRTNALGDVTLVSTTSNGNFLLGAPGDLSGLFNNQANYSFNAAPDFVFKAAWEPGWGHYEVFGLVSTFRSRIFPCATASVATPCPINAAIMAPSAFGATNDTRAGGGFGANAHAPFFNHHLDVGLHALAGSGVGRYGDAGLPDVTVRGDGTLALLTSAQGLASLELHLGSKLDIYGYGGGEYVGRGSYVSATGGTTGYGSPSFSNAGCRTETLPNGGQTVLTSVTTGSTPVSTGVSPTAYNGFLPGALGSCTADTRFIAEGTAGFWYRFYNGPRGRLQYGLQYSYVTRETWRGNAGGDPHGVENMAFASFRYYLP